MAEYHSPCVVTPNIPLSCLNAVEKFILTTVLQHERVEVEQALYLFSEEGIDEEIKVSRAKCEAALSQTEPGTNHLAMHFAAEISAPSQREDPEPLVCFINALDPLHVLQGIVRRYSERLPYVVVQQALTCTRMRPDGFGGAATFIAPDRIEHICTTSWARERIEALRTARGVFAES